MQADRAGAGDQQRPRSPGARTLTDALGVIPSLGHDARRLQQHGSDAERGIDLDQEIGLDAKELGAVAVALLDAAFGVAAVAAHVPLVDGARGTRNRIRPPYDADDMIAGLHAATGGRLLHTAERFMTDHQPVFARWSPAIRAGDDLTVRAANTERERTHQHCAVRLRRVGNVFEPR